jgi:hypothetical protein
MIARPRVRAGGVHSIATLTIENAVEGCVHETFGAAICLAQAISRSEHYGSYRYA